MTGDGAPLRADAFGLPAGAGTETFVLLHGFGGWSFSWRTWTHELARRGHVVPVDLKGFGRAQKPDDEAYGPVDQAELVVRLILGRDLTNVTLIGHSLGGGIALLVALRLRDLGESRRLARLVLVAAAAYRQPLPPFVQLAKRPRLAGALMRILGARTVMAQALRMIVYDAGTVDAEQIRGYAAPMGNPGATRALVRAALQIVPPSIDDIVERYGEIAVPALLLWGRNDRVVPLWVGQRLRDALPASTLRILDRCGHLPAEERPEASLGALRAFLDGSAQPLARRTPSG